MKHFLSYLLLLPLASFAQDETSAVKLKFEARAEYANDSRDEANSGLQCYVADMKLEGDIGDGFAYKYRQRLNKSTADGSFFDATDWLYLTYKATDNVSLMAGKWIVAVGCWETEPAPIDIYQVSEFCYNYDCYQWGGSVILNTDDKQQQLYLQASQSPYRRQYEERAGKGSQMWAYSALWIGDMKWYHTFSSVNLLEREPGRYLGVLSLGNRIDLGRNLTLDMDFMSRNAEASDFLKDYTTSCRLTCRPSASWGGFVKLSHDVNKTGHTKDLSVYDGTDITRLGACCEYYPMKNDKVRIHANYSYAFGKNTNPNGVLHDNLSLLSLGLTWRMIVL